MKIFKVMKKIYEAYKDTKHIYNDKLEKLFQEVQRIDENSKSRTENKYRNLFDEYKKMSKAYVVNIDDSLDYMNGKISKKEYEMKNKIYNEKINQAIQSVEEGSLTYEEFFNKI